MKEKMMAVQNAWNRYIGGNEPIPEYVSGVRPEILNSWRRSKKHADPYSTGNFVLPPEEYSYILEKNAVLISIATPYLEKFYDMLQNTKYQILLTDQNGVQLRSITADEDISILSKSVNVLDGCVYSEDINGTNGVSLCLKEEKPMLVYGAEHYNYQFNHFVCYSSPIHNPSGRIIGCICIMGELSSYQPNMINIIQMAINGIENELKLTQTNHLLELSLNLMDRGIILTDSKFTILQANNRAVKILHLEKYSAKLHGSLLSDYIDLSPIHSILRLMTNSENECTLLCPDGQMVHVQLIIRSYAQKGPYEGTHLILINTQKRVHEQVSQTAGYIAHYTFSSIIGNSRDMQEVKELGMIAAKSNSNILIFGESGTGKELLAQAIHNASARKNKPFVAINCASIPKGMVESELFGYEHGIPNSPSIGGKPGKLELAHGGTLFLDEIGSMSLDAQASLLRFLQTKEIIRIGGKTAKTIDVHIIASTNTNLLASVGNNTFRNDLYYRLNVLSITIPPLREHTEDILLLADYFIEKYNKILNKNIISLDDEAAKVLLSYPWPGNIRELENTIERGVNLERGMRIQLGNLPLEIVNRYLSNVVSPSLVKMEDIPIPVQTKQASNQILSPEIQEYNRLLKLLKKECGHVQTIAVILGIPVSTLYRTLRKYELNPKDFKLWNNKL